MLAKGVVLHSAKGPLCGGLSVVAAQVVCEPAGIPAALREFLNLSREEAKALVEGLESFSARRTLLQGTSESEVRALSQGVETTEGFAESGVVEVASG